MIDNPARLVIDVYGKIKKAEKPGVQITKKRVLLMQVMEDMTRSSRDGKLYEKNVVLDIALKLKKILAQISHMRFFNAR